MIEKIINDELRNLVSKTAQEYDIKYSSMLLQIAINKVLGREQLVTDGIIGNLTLLQANTLDYKKIIENYKVNEQKLLTINPYSRVGKKLKGIKGIVVHWVANTNSTGIANRNFFENRKLGKEGYGSAHYIIGLKGETIQCIPDSEIAYHVGAKSYTMLAQKRFNSIPNSYTIGIECCHIKDNGEMSKETYDKVVELTADLISRYNLTKEDIYLHNHITGKDCHKWFVDNPNEFIKFKENVDLFIVNKKISDIEVKINNTINEEDKKKLNEEYSVLIRNLNTLKVMYKR